jgi:hypothetical protein
MQISVDLLSYSFYAEEKRRLEKLGFTTDKRRHNRFQKWTIISHADPEELERLFEHYEREGYDVDKES